MNIPKDIIANEMFEQNLWWSYSQEAGQDIVTLSKKLSGLLARPIVVLEDVMGNCKTPQLRLKVSEALESTKTDIDMRFIASYETLNGKRSYQHQLKVLNVDDNRVVWVNCIDVSEMVALEREIVDAQGRLSIAKMSEREELLKEQHRFVSESYDKQSRFLALLSHELRSPLLGISSLVKRMRGLVDASPEVVNMLKTINMTAQQATYLVNDILTYSQTEYDAIKLHPAKLSLTELLENVKQLTKSIAADKGLIISLVHIGKHDEVLVDGVRLTQVLINLIVNSIKFTQFGGVNIEIKESKDGVFVFTITDSGEGISSERVDKIFEPFAQLDTEPGRAATNTRYLGAGLGLFVVQQLVELMDSDIHVVSELGVGTTFQFTLKLKCFNTLKSDFESHVDDDQQGHLIPLQTAVKPKAKIRESLEDSQNVVLNSENDAHDQYKILVADDSKINRMVIAGYLADLNCEVFEAKDGREAWALFQQHEFDYVLLDIQMPFLDGVEVCKKIQEYGNQGKTKNLKGVFAITAGGDSDGFIDKDEHPRDIGFDEWLVKPVNKNQIIQLLKTQYRQSNEVQSSQKASDENTKVTKSDNGDESKESLEEKLPVIDDIPQQFHHLFSPFILEMKEGLDALHELNKKAELDTIKKQAHYLKGNCMLFQLHSIVKLFKQIEDIQEKSQLSDSKASSRQMKTEGLLKKIAESVKSLEMSS